MSFKFEKTAFLLNTSNHLQMARDVACGERGKEIIYKLIIIIITIPSF